MGLKTFSSKCPLLPPTVTATWFPITWAATMVTASHWVGFTFPVRGRERKRLRKKEGRKRSKRGMEAREEGGRDYKAAMAALVIYQDFEELDQMCKS